MPDISRFKSVSVSTSTHDELIAMAKNRFEVPVSVSTNTHNKLTDMAINKFGVQVSVQKVIDYLIEKELKKKNGRSNGKSRS